MEPKQPSPLTNETKSEAAENIKIARRLQKLGRMIERELQKASGVERPGFALLVMHGGRVQYCGNVERSSMKEAMKELVARWGKPGEELGIPTMPLGGMDKAN